MRAEPSKLRVRGEKDRTTATAGNACLHELFEAQVARAPDSEALVAYGKRLTYGELNRMANAVALRLRSVGVGPETIVAILLERSAELVGAILGVLKAGGAYLPLDPAYPPDRLAFMLEDSRAKAIVARPPASTAFFQTAPQKLPVISPILGDPRNMDTGNPSVGVQPSNLAYVIYTSGSMGTPKAVAVEHRNSAALIEWADQTYSSQELSGVLAGVSVCFDPSILDLFVPLCLGGKVILAENTLALPGLAAAQEVRMINSVPSVIRDMLRIGGIPTSLETINLGGEPLSAQLVDQIYALGHVKRVYDLYGPTETTTCSTFALRSPGKPANVGRPIPRTQIHLLDDDLRPVAPGSLGEVFIGGAGVARGYLHRPELTAERFLPVPLPGGVTARLYRTGDLGRLNGDGSLEYVGRKDQQVKIRGFRVELGEVETALLSHSHVDQAIVVSHEQAPGERRLAAYVVARSAAGSKTELVPALRSHLQSRLPEYMMPSTFVVMDRFDLMANGKVSRDRLPAPDRTRAAAGDFQAPRTPTEELLCGIWTELLGIGRIGTGDDFFHLGGDSLLFTVMLTRVEEKSGVKLPLQAIQQARSVRRLAAFLEKKREVRRTAADIPLMEIQPRGSRPPLFLVHGLGGGMLWGYANLARHLGTDQPVFAFRTSETRRPEEADTIEKIASGYLKELKLVQPEGPYALGGYCFGGIVAYEMARQLREQGQRVSLVALMDSAAPDSKYLQFRWTPVQVCKFLRNVWHLAVGFWNWDRSKKEQFARWKLRVLSEKIRKRKGSGPQEPPPLPLDERIDLSGVPPDQRLFWESHLHALDQYRTRPYDGRVLLIRTWCHPVKCSFDTEHGWGEFARGGVSVRVIPCSHEMLLDEPYVAKVARELKTVLDELPAPAPKSPAFQPAKHAS